jgi:hypothetical protein
MVPITKGQPVKDDDSMVVVSDNGQYGDADLIMCAHKDAPDVPTAMLQAQYVAYGGIVYRYNTPEELGKAVFALDPAATLDAVVLYKEDETRRRARNAGVLEPENPVPAPDAAVETPVDTPVVEPAAPSEEFVPPVEPTTNPDVSPVEPQPATNADTVGEVLPSGGIDTSMSTTTVEGVVAEPSSSSTDISSEVFIQ